MCSFVSFAVVGWVDIFPRKDYRDIEILPGRCHQQDAGINRGGYSGYSGESEPLFQLRTEYTAQNFGKHLKYTIAPPDKVAKNSSIKGIVSPNIVSKKARKFLRKEHGR